MNDLERFEEFFKQMGVPYVRWEPRACDSPEEDVLSVADGIFKFANKQFVGVEGDEFGYFKPRVK
jgi:hypothetical protein